MLNTHVDTRVDLNSDMAAYQRESRIRVSEAPYVSLYPCDFYTSPSRHAILVARHKKTGNTFPAYILEIKACEGGEELGVNR